MKFLFLTFIIAPGIVFGPLALLMGVMGDSFQGFAIGAVVTALSWGYLLRDSEGFEG